MTGGSFTLTSTLLVQATKTLSSAGVTVTVSPTIVHEQALSYGTGEGSVSSVVLIEQGLPAGASHTFDLFDGSMTDVYGDPVTLRRVRAFAFWVEDGGDSSGVSLAGGDSNPSGLFWLGTPSASLGQTVYPDGPPACGGGDAGAAVTSTARTLKVTNLGAVEATYKLVLVGTPCVPGVPMGLLLTLTYP